MAAHIAAGRIRLKRAHAAASDSDGTRVLVDRLWPRGVSKADAALDEWMKDIAPSSGLRQWFDHDPERWEEFQRRYRRELDTHADLLSKLRRIARQGRLTLVYSARDERHNDAVLLRKRLLGR